MQLSVQVLVLALVATAAAQNNDIGSNVIETSPDVPASPIANEQSPVQSPEQSPQQSPFESPVQSPLQESVKSPVQSPVQQLVKSPMKLPLHKPCCMPLKKLPDFGKVHAKILKKKQEFLAMMLKKIAAMKAKLATLAPKKKTPLPCAQASVKSPVQQAFSSPIDEASVLQSPAQQLQETSSMVRRVARSPVEQSPVFQTPVVQESVVKAPFKTTACCAPVEKKPKANLLKMLASLKIPFILGVKGAKIGSFLGAVKGAKIGMVGGALAGKGIGALIVAPVFAEELGPLFAKKKSPVSGLRKY